MADVYQHTNIILWPIRSIMCKHDVIHKSRSTQHITLLSEDDRPTVTGNVKMFAKFGRVVFEICVRTVK